MSTCNANYRAQCVLWRKKFFQWSTAEAKHERETLEVDTQQRFSPGKGISKHIVGAKTLFTKHLSAVQILYTVKSSYECTKHQKLLNYKFLLFTHQRIPTGEIPYLIKISSVNDTIQWFMLEKDFLMQEIGESIHP